VKVIGISGSFDSIAQRRELLFPTGWSHDAAAVLVEDGLVTFGCEEERLNRIKHTSKAPTNSIRACLQFAGIRLSELDYVSIYGNELIYDGFLRGVQYSNVDANYSQNIRQLAHQLLFDTVGEQVDDSKLVFVPHHLCHAIGAYAHSGYNESLVITIDGGGDGLSGMVSYATPEEITVLQVSNLDKSLGFFYNSIIRIIGFGNFDEYKAMGLAPYGHPSSFIDNFESLYELLPGGNFKIHWDRIPMLYSKVSARKRNDPILQEHCDFAAALQTSLERLIFHVITYFRTMTGANSLCLAGGVAHNCSANGALLYSELFEHVFVHPAAHDAGCAVGAALYPGLFHRGFRPRESNEPRWDPPVVSNPAALYVPPLRTVFWGPELEEESSVEEEIEQWNNFVQCRIADDIATEAAQLIAEGNIVGWMQGRVEFGPRALGNRSILADPRPAANKDVINAMVKKREAFRPFAPAILEESVGEYFELPRALADFSFMTFVLRVRPEKRPVLGATTHVDGTARLQSVSRSIHPQFWQLIEAFRQITGIPVLLNTSFNNNAEPIVTSAHDGITCFLTTGINYLVIGRRIVSKRPLSETGFLHLYPRLASHLILRHDVAIGRCEDSYRIANTYDDSTVPISSMVWNMLKVADGTQTLQQLLPDPCRGADRPEIWKELRNLWESRSLILRPKAC
jgi:carbamoyltransferase